MVRVQFLVTGVAFLLATGPATRALAADVTCYVDSVAGDDTKSGLSEAEAVQSRSKIPSSCTIVKFKRGSVFNLASGEYVVPSMSGYTSKITTLTNYGDASLPQPKFIKQRAANNGSMISAYGGNLTIDGLYLEGSESDAQMSNLAKGICIMAGANTKILNNEITNCDIGIMLSGTGCLVQGNYVHDLHISVDAAPGVDPNVVGGAEGIFVNASDNEVAYNSFINCSTKAAWTGGDCDGGATEVTVGSGSGTTVSSVKIHHNYSFNSCGFFEVSSMGALGGSGTATKGTFADSIFYNNVSVDSGWWSLLQVNNTDLKNIKWENNTLVHHNPSVNQGLTVIVYTAVSSGMSGGSLQPNTVFWSNQYLVFDKGVNGMAPDKNVVQDHVVTIKGAPGTDPGFVNYMGTEAKDFDLVAGSPAIDQGTSLAEITLDFINRAVPDPINKIPDVGAYEYQSTQQSQPPTFPGTIPPPAYFGGLDSGGVTGATGAGGAGGARSTTAVATGKGGAGGGTTAIATGGASGGVGGSTTETAGSGGETTATTVGNGKGGCSCRLGQARSDLGMWASLLGFALLALRRPRARR